MGKEKPGFLTPKAIANRIKAKGLQKLRWYCQMCQKQCRDENGFKCHTTSESHQRQLLLFAENSSKFMDEFSREFNKEYINTLKRRFGTKRVHSNIVYQEYINDRNHIHMNATRWLTLTDYVKWLGRQGICVVDETEKGWFVTWIDRDPETLRRQMEVEKKKKLDLDDQQRQLRALEKQIEKGKDAEVKIFEPTELKKSENEILKISFNKSKPLIKPVSNTDDEKKRISIEEDTKEKLVFESNIKLEKNNEEEQEDKEENNVKEKKNIFDLNESKKPKKSLDADLFHSPAASKQTPSVTQSSKTEKRKLSALDEIIQSEEKKREKTNRKDYWLHKNIVVKITTNKLGEKYYKKKAIVIDVKDLYTGVVNLIDTETIIQIDQAHLETVLPALGKQVLVLNGAHRGETAFLDEINEKEFSARITISSGLLKGRIVQGVQYEDISKINQ